MRSTLCASPRLRARDRRGFTLVELLVVITIITVMAGITWPVITSFLGRGDDVACQSRLREIGLAVQAYQSDHSRYPAYSGHAFLAELYRADIGIEPRQLICPASEESDLADAEDRAEAALEGKRGDPVGADATTYFARLAGKSHNSIRSARRRRVRTSRIPIVCDGTFVDTDGETRCSHGNYMFVLYLDGHVDRVELDTAKATQILKELGK
jgi:prepilin-type N-terminal cleavage/methylation domain-containing protein/prepilin-type processing-associated H-X9-DG protein